MKKKQDIQLIDRTELIWPNKRKEVERVELPFQTIETINLPRGYRRVDIFSVAEQQKIFEDKNKQEKLKIIRPETEWKNRLIWGDNLLIMGSLLKEYAGKINLIYIDPPFATGDDFSFTVNIGDQAEITKEPSALEVKAYRDTWGKGMQSYLQMMYDRLVLMKELLADNGSIFVHCDTRVNSYMRLVLEEIFGSSNFHNEIIWQRSSSGKTTSKNLSRDTDTIFWFSKSENYIFNPTYQPLSATTIAMYNMDDNDGRGKYRLYPLQKTASPGPETTYDYTDNNGKVWKCPRKGWRMKYVKLKALENDGRLYLEGNTLAEKAYWDERENEGRLANNLWNDIPNLQGSTPEIVGYPTQKPEKLLDRIIKLSSNEGGLVADFFCGSGTTGIVAEKLGRQWIMSDLGRFATHTARKRFLDMRAKPFIVQNLGKYERHRWVKLNGRYKNYLRFILELYHAEPIEGFTNLHGKKDKAFVRIGAVDAPVTLSEIREALSECKENKIKSLDVLGWEWEMGLHDLVKEEAERYGIKLSTFQIPREVMELNVSDPKVKEDIHFYELAYLEVGTKTEPFDKTQGRGRVVITLKDFIIPNPELLPEEVKDKVKNWSDFVDYWAVDWMFNQHEEQTEEDDTFHNMNQRYRTRKEPKLELLMDYTYPKAGKYNILVKVIDIFGNDTTKLIKVKV